MPRSLVGADDGRGGSYGMVVGGVDVEAVGGAVETVVVCGTPVVVADGCVVVGTTGMSPAAWWVLDRSTVG